MALGVLLASPEAKEAHRVSGEARQEVPGVLLLLPGLLALPALVILRGDRVPVDNQVSVILPQVSQAAVPVRLGLRWWSVSGGTWQD